MKSEVAIYLIGVLAISLQVSAILYLMDGEPRDAVAAGLGGLLIGLLWPAVCAIGAAVGLLAAFAKLAAKMAGGRR